MVNYGVYSKEHDELECVFQASDDVGAADWIAKALRKEMSEVPEHFEDGGEPHNYSIVRVKKDGDVYEWDDETDFVFSVHAVWSNYHRVLVTLAHGQNMRDFERQMAETEELLDRLNADGRSLAGPAKRRGRLH